ncbi:PAS domain-containing sensor histidine kinase [Halobacteria archaeon AArc-curdl1]|uniref:histidine kinase n=1 Tax=Natronosalvus hydrolyticus TaxID=2979988 RepID=A0AAP3E9G3_9EURY|nr:PAS domain-containing sensor histidine kinase [Halobacteria archaeon AArc-curdl1]
MTRNEPAHVVLVNRNGQLEKLAATLRRARAPISVHLVSALSALWPEDGSERDLEPDCVVVCHSTQTDGIAQLEAVRERLEVPVVVFSLINDIQPVQGAIEGGAADVICGYSGRKLVLINRFKDVLGLGEPDPLQTPEQRLESLLEHLPHQVFIKDDDHRIVDVSRVTAEEYGLEREQLRGLTDFELLHPPELAAHLFEEEKSIMEAGDPVINKVEHFVDHLGRDRWVSTSKAARYDEAGSVIGVLGTTRDVTEEKRQERMMHVLHEASRDLVSAETVAEVATVTADIAADIPDLPRVCIALGEGTILETVQGDQTVLTRYREAFERTVGSGNERFLTVDGEPSSVEDDAAVVLLPLGSHGVLGFESTSNTLDPFSVELARILAANVEVALDRAERTARLEAQNERLEQFASIVSHDLRNPMSTARGYLEAYRDSGDPEHADEIEHALDRMDSLTSDMLDLARYGRVVDDFETVTLESVVEAAWETVPTASATLSIVFDSETTVEADPDRLQEALENLFRNAIEHGLEESQADPNLETTDGGGLTVRLESIPGGFAVKDDGPGIPDSTKPDVFDLGFTDSTDGTGYGLYIVDQIVTAHGWSVQVADAENGGARFEITGLEMGE